MTDVPLTIDSVGKLIGSFENLRLAAGLSSDAFYYEVSSNTINFGYGIDLTAAAKDLVTQAVLSSAFAKAGISLPSDFSKR